MKTVAPEKYQKNLRKKEFNDSMIRTEGYIQNSPIPIGIESYDDSGNFINTALEINHVNAKARGSKSICRSNRTKSDHSKSSTGSQVTNSTDVGYSSVGSKSSTSTHGTISTKMTKASSHMNSRANSVLSSKTNSSSSQNSLVIGLDLLPTYSNSNTSSMNHGNNLTANSSSHLPVGHLSSRHSFTRSKSANSSNSHISRMVSKIEMLNNDIKKYKCQKHFEISFNQIKDKFATSHQFFGRLKLLSKLSMILDFW